MAGMVVGRRRYGQAPPGGSLLAVLSQPAPERTRSAVKDTRRVWPEVSRISR